ncbi:MAG: hypothetical protein BV456_06870 [Thermoplasmata archaeon M8B2D]|nr:MAG: hypothetical protein BV456_06870 [Thermoplasmata archaeon M8B2D]
MCLLTISYNGVNTLNEVDEKNIYVNQEILKITNSDEDNSDIITFNGREYHLPAFPDKTQEQLDKMIQNPQPLISTDELPDSFSWTNYNGGDFSTPARYQGSSSTCHAFGALGAMEAAINIAKGDPNFDRDLSEQYILSCLSVGWMSETIQNIKDNGPQGNNINGCPLESCMPYQANYLLPCENKCPNWNYYTVPPVEDNILWQVLTYGVTQITPSNPSDWNLLKSWIYIYGPIVVDIIATNGWSSYWSTHHSPTDWYYETGSGYTNHAQVCYGWVDDTSVTNGGYWILKNSWGTNFGYEGFNNIAYGGLLLGDRDVTWVTTMEWENHPPNIPNNPNPSQGSTNIDQNAELSWSCSDPDFRDTLTYDIYFGTSSNPPLINSDYTNTSYNPGIMGYNTKYYWKIIAKDKQGNSAVGPIWDFTTSDFNQPQSDLVCEGDLNWENIKHGTKVNGTFTVRNNGDVGSNLNWEVDSYPEWGSWTFTPNEGTGLMPEDGMITVEVTVVVPKGKNKNTIIVPTDDNEYTGYIRVVNKDNADNYNDIPVTLTISKTKVFNLMDFYKLLIFRFPFMVKILNQYI